MRSTTRGRAALIDYAAKELPSEEIIGGALTLARWKKHAVPEHDEYRPIELFSAIVKSLLTDEEAVGILAMLRSSRPKPSRPATVRTRRRKNGKRTVESGKSKHQPQPHARASQEEARAEANQRAEAGGDGSEGRWHRFGTIKHLCDLRTTGR